jgi:hypothetical protein
MTVFAKKSLLALVISSMLFGSYAASVFASQPVTITRSGGNVPPHRGTGTYFATKGVGKRIQYTVDWANDNFRGSTCVESYYNIRVCGRGTVANRVPEGEIQARIREDFIQQQASQASK